MMAAVLALAAAAACASGAWITDAEMAALEPKQVFARQAASLKLAKPNARYQNRHILFRRKLTLGEVKRATLRITADDYYKLYVNGRFVGMGPASGTPACTYYNAIDVTPYFVRGENTIAVHTYYQGLVNRVWVSGDNRHGLWLELEADGRRVLGSDESFRVARHTGFSSLGVTGYDTQFRECYDAGADEVGFERPDFDDSGWAKAVRHPRGGDYTLVEQPTPMVETERIAPVAADRLSDGSLRFDFGGVYVGYVEFAAKGPRGASVEILCGQELRENPFTGDQEVRADLRCNCLYDERMILSGKGRDVLSQYDYKSFRYLQLKTSPGVEIDSGSVRLVARHQPFALKARPGFTDPRLKPVWDLCVNSFRYGVQEQIMDCMDREKGCYLGDGCYTMLAYSVLTEDWRNARRFVDDFLRTASVDRGLLICANCSFMQEIGEYPLMLFFFVKWYLDRTGDEAFVRARYAALKDVLDCYRERYARADGLICTTDRGCFVEWPQRYQDGYDARINCYYPGPDTHSAMNAWYIGAIRCQNAIAERLGLPRYADAAPLEEAFRRTFWDPKRHLFVDRDGSDHVSLPGNAYANFVELAPKDDPAAHGAYLSLIREKRYDSINLFQYFPVFSYLRRHGERVLLDELLVSPEAWLRIVREGGTRSFEGWGRDTKWNTSLFHLTTAAVVLFLADSAGAGIEVEIRATGACACFSRISLDQGISKEN